ncbi:hypothetical protein A33K_18157 [Burkholderia humptydooensis MSMB43]|uniref:Uncharacterized protein n=1 Tax=Burkholderia humptydooensis MSMB43 TaxID=441157 RepID=A0ABN0FYX7_9BURK|nr:hypothetical protein A33K_18157 [Burkholderia humptydooensis MSMB43]
MTRYQEVTAGPLAGTTQISIILPKFDLSLMSNQFRIRKGNLSGHIHQPPDMVGMGVCEQNCVDRGWFDASKQ